jgi:subtilisin family serine protease
MPILIAGFLLWLFSLLNHRHMRKIVHRLQIFTVFIFAASFAKAQMPGDPQPPSLSAIQQISPSKEISKLSEDLKQLYQTQTSALNRQQRQKPDFPNDGIIKYLQLKGDRVVIDVSFSGSESAAIAELKKMGMEIKAVFGHVISGIIAISALPAIESSANIKFARPAYKPLLLRNRSSSNKPNIAPYFDNKKPTPVISQGDTAQGSYLARKQSKVNGKGTKVGILSDSYNLLGTAELGILGGELPGKGNPLGFKKPVEVLEELDVDGIDEGRAMAEIVHDVAPGADLAFHTAFLGEADFANGILELAAIGCDVIVDDIIYFAEPFFQDGIIAQAVDQVKKKGVTYFSSAGNQGLASYESEFRESNVEILGQGSGTAHNFSAPGATPRYLQPIYIPSGGTFIPSLQWDQSSFAASGVGAVTDIDVYLANSSGQLVAGSASDNIASGEPTEIFGYTNNTSSVTFFLIVLKFAGPSPGHLKYINYGDGAFYLTNPAIPGILSPTLVGHAKAEGAIATGAAFYLQTPAYGVDPPKVEYFSSFGGVANYLDIAGNHIAPLIRKKPEITAPDGVNTSFFDPFGGGDISQDSDAYPNFFGTSAAAPHAAGVAALMIEAQKYKTLSPDQIKGILSANTYDMDNTNTPGFDQGFDFNTGYGFIKADKAVAMVDFPNKYVKNLSLKPLCSDDPDNMRSWEINNPNPFDVEAKWSILGSNQTAKITAAPGKSWFSSKTFTLRGNPAVNLGVIEWEDNFGATKVDMTYSTQAKCNGELITSENSDVRLSNAVIPGSTSLRPDIIEAYPNPATTQFKLYVALANTQSINLEIFNIEGRKLYERRNAPANGIITIDASRYGSGVYILKTTQGTVVKTLKLIKQ